MEVYGPTKQPENLEVDPEDTVDADEIGTVKLKKLSRR